MASRGASPDLSPMYGFRRSHASVREPAAPYGAWPDPRCFPGEDVLADLEDAEAGAAGRILARYAALRLWLLRQHGADAAVGSHAAEAARAHLEAERIGAGGEWVEGELLDRLGDAPAAEAPGILALAAAEAGRVGDAAGAAALRRAAREALLARLRARRRGPPRG